MRWLSGKENGKLGPHTINKQPEPFITSLEMFTFRIVYSSIRCCRVVFVAYDLRSDATGSRGEVG